MVVLKNISGQIDGRNVDDPHIVEVVILCNFEYPTQLCILLFEVLLH